MGKSKNRNTMDYHADDYGLSIYNSKRIVQLISMGKLDSISIIPNMSACSSAIDYLFTNWDNFIDKPLVAVHLNIVDGYSLSGIVDPLLTNEIIVDGQRREVFRTSWIRLFLSSFNIFKKKRIREMLKQEFVLQIDTVYSRLSDDINADECGKRQLRLDSHMHTHMIPVVFDAMLDAVRDLGLEEELSFVRVSKEPLIPFIKKHIMRPYNNLIKNILLNLLSYRAKRILENRGIECSLLWGLVMSGEMDEARVTQLMNDMTIKTKRKQRTMEILFHPGIVLDDEIIDNQELSDIDKEFVTSQKRNIEYNTLMNRA